MTERDKAQETYLMYRFDRENGHDTYIRRTEEALRYYNSRQWGDADIAKRREEERPWITVNEVFNTINSIVGELDQLSTDVRFTAGTGDEDTARVLNKLSEHVDRSNKMYVHDARVKMDGLLSGRGFYELRMDFDDSMQGNILLKAKRPQNVILPADIESVNPDEWSRVTTTDVLSLIDIDEMFGRSVANEMKGMPLADWLDVEDRNLAHALGMNNAFRTAELGYDVNNKFLKQYRMVSAQYIDMANKEFFVDKQTGDMSEIPENWDREKIRYAIERLDLGTVNKRAKTLKWRVVVNDKVVHDEDSPYKFFTIVPYMPYFNDGVAMSLFDVLQGPQDMLNKSLSEEIHILSLSSNTGWKVKNGSLRNMTTRQLEQKGAKNGLVLMLDEVDDAERIQPGSPPAGFENMSMRAQQWTKSLAGVTPSMQGAQRADAAGEGIRMNLLRAPINLSVPLTAFHYTKHLLAERKLNLFQTYYTETRIIKIASGPYGKTEEIAINMPTEERITHDLSVGSYIAHIMPTGSRMQAEEYAFDELVELANLGVTVPKSMFVEASSINAKADAVEKLLAANNGDVSPEEQRAQQLQLEQMELENADKGAGIENKNALTRLSDARAQRAVADASTPAERMALDRARLISEHTRDQNRLAEDQRKHTTDTAVELTKLEVEAKNKEEDRKVTKEVKKAAPKPKSQTRVKKAATPKKK